MADVVKAGFWYCQGSQESFANSDAPIHFTHLFCASANISSDFLVTIPTQYQDTFSSFTQNATNKKRDIKTLVSIGGADSDPKLFPKLVSQADNRKLFIQSSIDLARTCDFHGLDLCWPWEHPLTEDDTTNLGHLLNEWKQAIVEEAPRSNKTQLLLSATVFYTPIIDTLTRYPLEAISRKLDLINVRAYDFYVPKLSPEKTGPPAPLHNKTNSTKCVDASISNWIRAGVLANKIVLGLPFVGFEWLLAHPDNQHGLFAPANGPPPGNGDGHIFYRDIIAKPNFTHKFDEDYVTDYCYGGNHWIGYDDTETIKKKIQYAKEKTLGGYFAWHVCADDPNWTLSKTASEEWDNPGQGDQ